MSEKKSPEKGSQIEVPKSVLATEDGMITISHAQAKQLLKASRPKRERTEAQKANTERLLQMNREKWAKIKAEKEQAVSNAKKEVEEAVVKHTEERKKNNITINVLPKKKIAKKEVVVEETSEDEDSEAEESEEEEVVVKKVVKKVSKVKPKEVAKKAELLKQIDSVLQPNPQQSRYASLLSKMF